MGKKWPCLLKRHATWQSTRTPHLSTLRPHSLWSLLGCTISPKIVEFKASFQLARAHVGPTWLKMALNHSFEHPKWCRNTFKKNHFGQLLDPQGTPVTLPKHMRRACSWSIGH